MRDHLVLTEALNERVTQLLGSPGRVVCTMRYTSNIFVGVRGVGWKNIYIRTQ